MKISEMVVDDTNVRDTRYGTATYRLVKRIFNWDNYSTFIATDPLCAS